MGKPKIRVVAAQIERDGKYLITQRKPTSSLPLLWEFPGGRAEEGESDTEALCRELIENLDTRVKVVEASVAVTHEYEAYTINFRVYRCQLEDPKAEIKKIGVHDFVWVTADEFDNYEFPGADQASVDALLSEP